MGFCIPSRLSISSLIASLCVAIAAWLTPVGDRIYHQMNLPWNLLTAIFSTLLFLAIDILLLQLAYRYNTKKIKSFRATSSSSLLISSRNVAWLKDAADFVVLVIVLALQAWSWIDPKSCGWPCFQLVLALLGLVVTFFLIIKPTTDFGVADLFLSIFSAFWVYFSQQNQVLNAVVTSLICFFLLVARNHYEELKDADVPRTVYEFLHRAYPAVETALANFFLLLGLLLGSLNWIISLGEADGLELEQADHENEPLLQRDYHHDDVASSSTVGEVQEEITPED